MVKTGPDDDQVEFRDVARVNGQPFDVLDEDA
jgi:hypothetical protein